MNVTVLVQYRPPNICIETIKFYNSLSKALRATPLIFQVPRFLMRRKGLICGGKIYRNTNLLINLKKM